MWIFKVIVLFLILFIPRIELQAQVVDHLSVKEKNELKLFFHQIFADNPLGYTLFGDKPMSFCSLAGCGPCFSTETGRFWAYFDDVVPLFGGLCSWKKISSKIRENYLLIIRETRQWPDYVILINKKEFNKQFEQNIDLFKKYYGDKVALESVLAGLANEEKCDGISNTPLFQSHLLLGIMLGFGRHNSLLFERREELLNPKFSLIQTVPSNGFSSVEEEVVYLWQHLQRQSTTHDYLLRVSEVAFVGDPDDLENQALARKYETLHEKLIAMYDREDWLGVILNQLCSDDPPCAADTTIVPVPD